MNEYDDVKNFETVKVYKQTLEDTLTKLFFNLIDMIECSGVVSPLVCKFIPIYGLSQHICM